MDYKTVSKKGLVMLLLCVLVGLPACKKTKKNTSSLSKKQNKIAQNNLYMPLDNETIAFDAENIKGLFAEEEETNIEVASTNSKTAKEAVNDYTWTEVHEKDEENFKTVYFDFDKHTIRPDQKEAVTYDAVQLKQLLAEARQEGNEPIVVIEGHACSSAGSDEYNLAKSQNRANTVFKVVKDLGVPTENIKVVGRGKDIPVVVDGKKVTGSRTQQWPNRRVELHIIKSQ